MKYTVKEVAELAGVTIKTLYHYHKVGLLIPHDTTEAGYRLYSDKELTKLQEILYYRELDISLEKIKQLLSSQTNRLACLTEQKNMLKEKQKRIACMVKTIDKSIDSAAKGEPLDKQSLFKGLNKQEWIDVLSGQRDYLQNTYQFNIALNDINAETLNELAGEPEQFMHELAQAFRQGYRPDHAIVDKLIRQHIQFINTEIMSMTAETFITEARFFVDDDFHREILEEQQPGLSYYLYTAAVIHAEQ